MKSLIEKQIKDSIFVKNQMLSACMSDISSAASMLKDALLSGKKLLICGNGGSAADSQHMAAEFVVRFRVNRNALPAIALTTDSSILTACANDFSYDEVFSRQVEALAQEGDILIGISTSGRSKNVLKALESAKELGVKTIGLCGKNPNDMGKVCDVCIAIPSDNTARIQEGHILVIHILCDLVEQLITGELYEGK